MVQFAGIVIWTKSSHLLHLRIIKIQLIIYCLFFINLNILKFEDVLLYTSVLIIPDIYRLIRYKYHQQICRLKKREMLKFKVFYQTTLQNHTYMYWRPKDLEKVSFDINFIELFCKDLAVKKKALVYSFVLHWLTRHNIRVKNGPWNLFLSWSAALAILGETAFSNCLV